MGRIILGKEPEYTVDYSHVNDEPDEGDSGNCRPLGRWHDLGTGSGLAIAAARSEEDIYKWAFNWTEMCDCRIVPVLTDNQCRQVIRSKADFQQKLDQVRASMASAS